MVTIITIKDLRAALRRAKVVYIRSTGLDAWVQTSKRFVSAELKGRDSKQGSRAAPGASLAHEVSTVYGLALYLH